MSRPTKTPRGERWSWRLPAGFPWGQRIEHSVTPLHLLDLPLAFTQNALLSPSEFVQHAAERGVALHVEQLLELHRRRVLVPMFRLLQRPSPHAQPVPVAPSVSGYRQFRSNLALVIEGAQVGQVVDAASVPFRSWEAGLSIPSGHGGPPHRYPSVFYSPYQLLALRAIDALTREMEAHLDADRQPQFHLKPLHPTELTALDGCRQLAILLSALDMRYLPRIALTAHHANVWQSEDGAFSAPHRIGVFFLAPETLAGTANQLLVQARFLDPLGEWYELVRQAHPDTWSKLKGAARLAMDYRIAAEVLLRCLDDLGREDLSTPPPTVGRMVRAVLDDRLRADPADLESLLTDRGLSPHPAVLLILEGKTEMTLMPKVLAELYGGPVPPTLIECVNMDSVDRDLDLLVRHVLGPRFGSVHGDVVLLTRPPTRILVAVDPEKDYATPALSAEKRETLVRRLHEALPEEHRTPEARAEIDSMVQITTWVTGPWEFANFTNSELASAILSCVTLPPHVTTADLEARVETQRHARRPNIEVVTSPWRTDVPKVALAKALEGRLLTKVRRGAVSRQFRRLPAGRVAVQALELALSTHRRQVVMRIR